MLNWRLLESFCFSYSKCGLGSNGTDRLVALVKQTKLRWCNTFWGKNNWWRIWRKCMCVRMRSLRFEKVTKLPQVTPHTFLSGSRSARVPSLHVEGVGANIFHQASLLSWTQLVYH